MQVLEDDGVPKRTGEKRKGVPTIGIRDRRHVLEQGQKGEGGMYLAMISWSAQSNSNDCRVAGGSSFDGEITSVSLLQQRRRGLLARW